MSSLSLEDDATELSLLRLLLLGNCLGRLTFGGGGEVEVEAAEAEDDVADFRSGGCCMFTILAAASNSPFNSVGVVAVVAGEAGVAGGGGWIGGCSVGRARAGRPGSGGCAVCGDSGEDELPSWSTKE